MEALKGEGGPRLGLLVFSKHAEVVFAVRCAAALLSEAGVAVLQYVVDEDLPEDRDILARFQLAKAPGLVAFYAAAAAAAGPPPDLPKDADAGADAAGDTSGDGEARKAAGFLPYSKAAFGPPTFRSIHAFAAQVMHLHAPEALASLRDAEVGAGHAAAAAAAPEEPPARNSEG